MKDAFEGAQLVTVNKEWTLEEAWAANQAVLEENPEKLISDPTLPFAQWAALRQLDECRKNYEEDRYQLMTAIRICAAHHLPLPDWAADAYIKAYDSVNNARAKSWNTVFGLPYPKGTHLSAVRKRRIKKFAVWNEITQILKTQPDTPIDEYLFEMVGKKFGLGKTLASEYYYAAKQQLER